MRRLFFTTGPSLCLLVSLIVFGALCLDATQALAKREVPLVTGEHWIKASNGEKLSYLLGMATIIELEKEYQGEKPIPESLNYKLVKGLHDHSLQEIKQHLDTYYQQHPDKQQRPVVEVIWYELVSPDLKPVNE